MAIVGWDKIFEEIMITVPVELISFTASVNNNNVQLNWTTAAELNNFGFDILRQAQGDEWVAIGFISGHGTTTNAHSYSFTDETVSDGFFGYQLKQINFDGTFEYSNIVEIEMSVPSAFELEQNYPNPFNPTTRIKYSIPNTTIGIKGRSLIVQLIVYDILGNEVATLVNEEKTTGIFEADFDGNGLTSGIYFYQLKAGEFTKTKRMIILK